MNEKFKTQTCRKSTETVAYYRLTVAKALLSAHDRQQSTHLPYTRRLYALLSVDAHPIAPVRVNCVRLNQW